LPEVILLGGSGHAKVIIEIFREAKDWEVVGCITATESKNPVCGVPVLGDDSELERIFKQGVTHAFPAIGDNGRRSAVCARLLQVGFSLVNAISRHALVSPSVRFDSGIAIMPGAIINVDSTIATGAIVNTGATIDHDCMVGAYSHIGPGTNLAGGVTIGSGAFLGIGSRVVPGVRIGEWGIVGAGGVVLGDLPAHATAVGVPARIIRTVPKT
jgi:UDP-perosamine 4-acetyltransferase